MTITASRAIPPRRAFPAGRAGAIAVACLIATLNAGCAPILVGGAVATGATAIVQERSVGNAVDDAGIRLQLNDRLINSPRPVFAGVETEVVEGRVLLAGTVPTAEDRVEVVRLAWSVPRVRQVINEVEVRGNTGFVDYARDVGITSQLRARLLADPDIMSVNYTVETVNGTVYLIGIGQDTREIQKVTNHASRIAGVRQVVSYVITKDDPSRRTTAG